MSDALCGARDDGSIQDDFHAYDLDFGYKNFKTFNITIR